MFSGGDVFSALPWALGPAVTDLLAVAVVAAHGVVLALLLPFASHRTFLLLLSRRSLPPSSPAAPSMAPADPVPAATDSPTAEGQPAPRVTVQLPVFNESRVVERLIDATCRLSYPRDRLQVQVLDDSTDETTALAKGRARFWRRRGVDVTVLRRPAREGFKAGALAAGLGRATGEFLLILDADFLPRPDLLRRLLPAMSDPGVGMVQARWDHLNEPDSWLTRAQAVLLDGHFFFEQAGRYRGRRFFNFNGTAGLWRRQALEDAGGWQFDTLTEDLDVSYRAQMAGWRFAFLEEVGVAAELPPAPGALLVQQRRWAQGGVQTARKVLPRLARGPFPAKVKLEAFVHLCGHLAHPLALALSLLIVPAAFARRALGLDGLWWLDGAVFLAAAGPFVAFYLAAARKRGRRWGASLRGVGSALALGAGLSLLLCRSALRGLRRRQDPFERTPKRGNAPPSNGEPAAAPFPGRGAARAAGAVMVAAAAVALATGFWASLPFLALFASGHLALGGAAAAGGLRGFRQQKRPHGKPEGDQGPRRLWPAVAGLVRRKAPVAEECEPA